MVISDELIISLINKNYKKEAISYELDIPMEKLLELEQKMKFRKNIINMIRKNQWEDAKKVLQGYLVENSDDIIVSTMLLKVRENIYGEDVSNELEKLQLKVEKIGTIDDILNDLGLQIPKRKKKKINKFNQKEEQDEKEDMEDKDSIKNIDYSKLIEKYNKDLENNPYDTNKKNILAFTYYKQGLIEESRNLLLELVERKDIIAYRQLIYLEKAQGNYEDAKLWAYEAIEDYPDSIPLRRQMIEISKQDNDNDEVTLQQRKINEILVNARMHPLKYKQKNLESR